MAQKYSAEVCSELEQKVRQANLYRPMRISRYEPGTELTYDVQAVAGPQVEHSGTARVRVVVEKFVGGGYAGQVYRVKLLSIAPAGTAIPGLEPGSVCALKILVPPSTFARLFRNMLYWIGFQGPFQLQVNPAAARAGALWQKLIRRGAQIRFGDAGAVVDVFGTFVDEQIGSCGELREWVEGRTWRLEVDDHMDLLRRWHRGGTLDESLLGSPEYRAKREFMRDFVSLLYEMGAYEFARQYEWSTAKSQPNCMKRKGTDDDPAAGLVAVDFRAGLALLPFLPMSPGDVLLILRGIARGSLVQFDRGNLKKLQAFVEAHAGQFADMQPLLEDLKAAEGIYRDSVPDITHNHVRLLTSGRLWSTILSSAVTGWRVRGLVDRETEQRLRKSSGLTFLFFVVGLIPLLGKCIRRFWGRRDWRRHYVSVFREPGYLGRAFRARAAEKLIDWRRAGRVDAPKARFLSEHIGWFFLHLPFSLLPAGLHRLFTDARFAADRLTYLVLRPVRLYFNPQYREQWLREMLAEGQNKHMLSDEDANTIVSQLGEPFIQKYLKSLAVHVCTLPLTEITAATFALVYVLMHPGMPLGKAWANALTIVAVFQMVPVSPGSLVRGFYVVYLMVRERNFKDYSIALFLGFFRYIGYLAFPIQMTYRYPALARFMAAHWATEAVHVVPVFGERGALLEHWTFCLFYNWPLTIRRRMRERAAQRANLRARYWHVAAVMLAGALVFGVAHLAILNRSGLLPSLRGIWWLAIVVPLAAGVLTTLWAGGASFVERIVAAALCGSAIGALNPMAAAVVSAWGGAQTPNLVGMLIWGMFVFTILAAIGAIVTELILPAPRSLRQAPLISGAPGVLQEGQEL